MKKIFIGFNNAAGYGTRLLRGFKDIDVEAHLYIEGEHPFGYSVEGARYYKIPGNKWLKRIYVRLFFLKCLLRYDSFLFISTQTFLKDFKDLKILRFFKKRTMMIFVGCDVQQPELTYQDYIPFSSCHTCNDEYKNLVGCYPETKVFRTRKIEQLIDIIINDRALSNVLKRKAYHINQPINIQDFPKQIQHKENKIPVILHAPSNYNYKGTKYLIEAIEKLKNEFEFEFKLISNVKLKQLYEEIASSDLVVDQLIQGWYGMLPLEAMMYEKPVICYLRDDVAKALPEDCPIISANPSNIYEVLKKLLASSDIWKEIGKQGREYVIKYHDARLIAKQYSNLLLNQDKI